MKKFYELYGKYLWIEIEGDIITDVNCSCEDFMFRKLTKKGEKIKVISLCKHLNRLIGRYYSDKKVVLR